MTLFASASTILYKNGRRRKTLYVNRPLHTQSYRASHHIILVFVCTVSGSCVVLMSLFSFPAQSAWHGQESTFWSEINWCTKEVLRNNPCMNSFLMGKIWPSSWKVGILSKLTGGRWDSWKETATSVDALRLKLKCAKCRVILPKYLGAETAPFLEKNKHVCTLGAMIRKACSITCSVPEHHTQLTCPIGSFIALK